MVTAYVQKRQTVLVLLPDFEKSLGLFSRGLGQGPQQHISTSILWVYPYLIGLYYKRVYMGYPYPNFCLCAFGGPY